jgi:type I restriction enzyme M protein
MKGAIVGDIVGSVYEWNNIKTKDFPLFREDCFFTDDTVMTVAVGHALVDGLAEKFTDDEMFQRLVVYMQFYGKQYKGRGYGGRFQEWIYDPGPQPYDSWGNGAPMRCSSAGWLAKSAEDARRLGRLTALPTHNHPEGVKAAQLTAELIYRAKTGEDKEGLRACAAAVYKIPRLDDIRPLRFSESSHNTMPPVLAAFFESVSFEDAIRNAVSLGGDSDTIAAITGSIAEAYYGVPDEIWSKAKTYLNRDLLAAAEQFDDRYVKPALFRKEM